MCSRGTHGAGTAGAHHEISGISGAPAPDIPEANGLARGLRSMRKDLGALGTRWHHHESKIFFESPADYSDFVKYPECQPRAGRWSTSDGEDRARQPCGYRPTA